MTIRTLIVYMLMISSLGTGYLIHNKDELVPTTEVQVIKIKFVNKSDREIIADSIMKLSPYIEREKALQYAYIINKECRLKSYDWRVVVAVMMVESSFREHISSNKGANGLMQLMPNTANELLEKSNIVANYKEPEINIKLGVQYLIHLEKKFERRDLSLVAYNRGPTRVRKELIDGNLPLGYLEKVMYYYWLIS